MNEVIKRLSEAGFDDIKKEYYLIVDDLDKNWMPDDILYLNLVKSLLNTVREINNRLKSVKILVALRTNIYYRVFRRTTKTEPQREKWVDVMHELLWEDVELKDLVNKRLAVLFREQYTKVPPELRDILPQVRKKKKEDPFDYILERTFRRPRDVLDFLNTAVQINNGDITLSWTRIAEAEHRYSKSRLDSIIDEWKDSFFGLPALFKLIKEKGPKFTYNDLSDLDLEKIWEYPSLSSCQWLCSLKDGYLKNDVTYQDIKRSVLNTLYLTGIIGIKNSGVTKTAYSYEQPVELSGMSAEYLESCTFYVHKMFWHEFGLSQPGR